MVKQYRVILTLKCKNDNIERNGECQIPSLYGTNFKGMHENQTQIESFTLMKKV